MLYHRDAFMFTIMSITAMFITVNVHWFMEPMAILRYFKRSGKSGKLPLYDSRGDFRDVIQILNLKHKREIRLGLNAL